MSSFVRRAVIKVEAGQWTGDNLDEMKALLAPYVESNEWDGVEVYSTTVEPFFGESAYEVLQFEAWGDDQEVDPGQWVVIYEDGEGEIMDTDQFEKMGFK